MLKFKVKSLEGLSDVEKAHYKQDGDMFVLELDVAIKTEEDITKLTGALEKERADHKDAKNKLSQYKQTPEEIAKMINEQAELKIRAEKIDDKSIADIVALRVKPFENEVSTLKEKLSEADKEKLNLNSKLLDLSLDTKVRSVAGDMVDPKAMTDVILRAKSMLIYNEEKQDFFDRNGADAKTWLEKTLPETTWGANNYGGGSKGKSAGNKASIEAGGKVFNADNNPFSKEKYNLTEQSLITKVNPDFAQELAKMAEEKK